MQRQVSCQDAGAALGSGGGWTLFQCSHLWPTSIQVKPCPISEAGEKTASGDFAENRILTGPRWLPRSKEEECKRPQPGGLCGSF